MEYIITALIFGLFILFNFILFSMINKNAKRAMGSDDQPITKKEVNDLVCGYSFLTVISITTFFFVFMQWNFRYLQ